MIQASRLGFSPTQNGYFTCEDEDLHLENKELTNEQWIEYDYDYVSKHGDWPIGLHFMAIKNMENIGEWFRWSKPVVYLRISYTLNSGKIGYPLEI